MVGKNKFIFRFRKFLNLYVLYAKMDLALLLRDTKYALLSMLADSISNLSALTGIFLLAWRFDGVGEIDKYDVLFMLGYVTCITGIFQMFCSNNTGHISRRIGRGQFEHMLIQPLPLWIQLVTEGFLPFTGSGNILIGGTVITIALHNLNITVTSWWILSLIFNFAISLTILISLSFAFSSFAFYSPVTAEEISSYVINLSGDLSQYPLSGMPLYVKLPLITFFPLGLMGWFPALTLLGKSPLGFSSLYPVFIAALIFIMAKILFTKGFNHYVKTGTNRYLPYGHRR